MKQLSKSEIETLNLEIAERYFVSQFFSKKESLSLADLPFGRFILQDKQPIFFYLNTVLVPTLKLLLQQPFLKKVTVDPGAIKFVAAGADIMRPGIVDLDITITKDSFVVVVDQTHKKPLCIARALFSAEEITSMTTGKVFKNIHHVGDDIWKFTV